jgi:hypothetical protein
MTKGTRTGTVYRSRSHDRHLNRRLNLHLLSAIGTAVLMAVGGALVAVLVHPPLLAWWLS